LRAGIAFGLCALVLIGQTAAWDLRPVRVDPSDLSSIGDQISGFAAHCVMSYYYLIPECGYVTVMEGIGENETYGIHFNMSDEIPWHDACDTSACLRLDIIEIVFFDVLPPGNDQTVGVKIYGADGSGEPTGDLLGNRDFAPGYTDTASFSVVEVDFTNGGEVDGLDLSACGGNFVVLLTWKNDTGHPLLVLDNVSTCVDSCAVNASCCEMGITPYTYPRCGTHTYFYGTEGSWSKQDSVSDPGGSGTYGWLEGMWKCQFCRWSAAAEPMTWGGIKALYK
jgi:hypothetical protein